MRNKELTAVFDRERLRFENADADVTICSVINSDSETVAVKGSPPEGDWQPGITYRFFGHWVKYTNPRTGQSEQQFAFNSCVEVEPLGEHGVISYLEKAPGIGPAMAKRLWAAFGQDAVREIREGDESVVREATGIRADVFEDARDYFRRHRDREECVIELLNLFEGRGVPKSTITRALTEWGNQAPRFIKKNPYLLMRFRGIGFRRCDHMYLSLGLDPSAMRRQAYCAWFGVASMSNGDTWVTEKSALAAMHGMIGSVTVDERKAIRLALRSGLLASTYTNDGKLHWDGDRRWFAEGRKARSESKLAGYISDALFDSCPVGVPDQGAMSDHQYEKMKELMSSTGCVKLLDGAGGTGKSFVFAQLVKHWMKTVGADQIALVAPTGKAAVRMTEAMSEYNIMLSARTIHSALGVSATSEVDGFAFTYGPEMPLPYRVVIVDEPSMVDCSLAASLFAARAKGTLFLLVGDVHQLLPVGHGAPLRDMISCGEIPRSTLTEQRRNSGMLLEELNRIRTDGEIKVRMDGNLQVVQAESPADQIRQMILNIDNWGGYDPIVITPTNKTGDLGRRNLNQILQNHLNAREPVKNSPFRPGDKVVCNRNGWLTCLDHDPQVTVNKQKQCYVANGDMGIVDECQPKSMIIDLQSPYRRVRVGRSLSKQEELGNDPDAENKNDETEKTGCVFELGYCISCHKSQGAQWPVVIVMLDENARRLCDRQWIYTALSRTETHCIAIGKPSVLKSMVAVSRIQDRQTFLGQQITANVADRKKDNANSISLLSNKPEEKSLLSKVLESV